MKAIKALELWKIDTHNFEIGAGRERCAVCGKDPNETEHRTRIELLEEKQNEIIKRLNTISDMVNQ